MYYEPKFHGRSFKYALKQAHRDFPNIEKKTLDAILNIGYEYGWTDGLDDGNSAWDD